jgi:Glucose-6-phosphate 1-dehydrogenase
MEAPTKADGPEAGESIRNAKVQVLNSIPPITIDECFLGQYEGKWVVLSTMLLLLDYTV